jgi:hypothetical protein
MRTKRNRNTQSPKDGAKQFGLDTSVKVHFSNAIHNTTMAINLARAFARR